MKTNAWFLFERSTDLPGQWEALCLDLDVLTYGSTLEDAIRMGIEAAQMMLSDDLQAGIDPRRRRSPDEDWQKLRDLMGAANDGRHDGLVAANLALVV